ncbi:MAG TPA: FAD:protein FMN transferase [Pirellulales bacterium]|jgi:thiamine biosynthesis lipoprotein
MPSDPTSNRREFLRGRAAADAIGAAIDRYVPLGSTAASPPSDDAKPGDAERYLIQISRPAMACTFAVFLNAGQYEQGSEAALAALDRVEALESQLTVYRDTSEVMRINRTAAADAVPVESDLFDLLSLAVHVSEQTAGAFDVTAGPLVKTWGFYKRSGSIPNDVELQAALARVGSRFLTLDNQTRSVRFLVEGLELNLGAIGKGYALDRAAQELVAAGVDDFLLHGGQSSVLARGSQAGTDGWIVGLSDPLRPERRLAEICLRDRALATSGASNQFFRAGGKRYGHILDPRTGWPAEGVFSSTAVASSAAEADALSTAFYTLGVGPAREYCREHAGIGMVLLHPGQGGSSVEMTTAGLDEKDLPTLK